MIETEKLLINTGAFYRKIGDKPLARFFMDEIKASKKPLRTLGLYTRLKKTEMDEVIFNPDRDIKLPKITSAIRRITKGFPSNLRIKEISRETGIPPEQINNIISRFKPKIFFNAVSYLIETDYKPVPPNTKVTPSQIKDYNLKSRKVLKAARYQSRAPGGGPVQRTRIQDYRITSIVKSEVISSARIVFVPEIMKTENEEPGHRLSSKSLFLLAPRRKKYHC